MKKLFFTLIAAAAMAATACGGSEPNSGTDPEQNTKPLGKDSLVMATYNIRCDNYNDEQAGRGWAVRWEEVAKVVQKYGFEIFGTQEGVNYQMESIKMKLPGYDYVGVGRDDGATAGEYVAIFYDTEKFELLDKGHFWLSTTPEEPGMGWDAQYPRISVWGKFRHKRSGFSFLFYTTHLDNKGSNARVQSIYLLIRKIKEQKEQLPVVVCGDFNADQTSEPYKLLDTSGLVTDAYTNAKSRYITCGTLNAFTVGYKYITSDGQFRRIDHIFLSKEFGVNNYSVPVDIFKTSTGADCMPSDHYPVVLKLTVPKKL